MTTFRQRDNYGEVLILSFQGLMEQVKTLNSRSPALIWPYIKVLCAMEPFETVRIKTFDKPDRVDRSLPFWGVCWNGAFWVEIRCRRYPPVIFVFVSVKVALQPTREARVMQKAGRSATFSFYKFLKLWMAAWSDTSIDTVASEGTVSFESPHEVFTEYIVIRRQPVRGACCRFGTLVLCCAFVRRGCAHAPFFVLLLFFYYYYLRLWRSNLLNMSSDSSILPQKL